MSQFREFIKRNLPTPLRNVVVGVRDVLSAPALEDIVMHDYTVVPDPDPKPRLTLIIPNVHPTVAFGGVVTALDLFLRVCRETGADARIITDEFERRLDRSVVDRRASSAGVDPSTVQVERRTTDEPTITLRPNEVFFAYNWWIALNLRKVIDRQAEIFGGPRKPFLYVIQDYEPLFYKFSSTHMLARLALDSGRPCWGVFNSSQLHDFFVMQGHRLDRSYVFEPKVSQALRPALEAGPTKKVKRLLVYGRPQIPRNCFPAVEKGLQLWGERYPQYREWEVVSAGLTHRPVPINDGRFLRSLGKLSLDDYANLLRTTSVGLSLMSSPHPSYPPLEMSHFGLLTVTNRYANKDLSTVHDNIISIPDIDAETIAEALAGACARFEADPNVGWNGKSHMPAFLDTEEWEFLPRLVADLNGLWSAENATPAPPLKRAQRVGANPG